MLRRLPHLVPYALLSFGLALALAASLGCGDSRAGDDAGVDPDGSTGDGGPLEERSCASVFSYRPDGPVVSVEVAGEWDWSSPEPLIDDNGDGVYTLDKQLAPGVHAYKLIVTYPGGGPEWILDPKNPYRKYDGGIENSGLRVEECRDPALILESSRVEGGGIEARVSVLRGHGGADIDAGAVVAILRHEFEDSPLGAAQAELSGQELSISVSGLAAGKYTLVVTASDLDGRAARPLRLPFWVEAERFDWRDTPIYMVMVDRFLDGNPHNNPAPVPGAEPSADFHGGDIAGITQAIDSGYFDQIGVRALWLSPFVENNTGYHYDHGGPHGVTPYHGYWPVKARVIDPRLGTEAELEAMVTAAHRRGIRVLMDFVINHVHEGHEYFVAHPEWFRTGCTCGTAGCDWTEMRLECLFNDFMPDVNWQNPEAGEAFIQDALWWLERFDLDGLRIDAVKHVEDAAIFNLATRIREELEGAGTEYFLLGETAMGWSGHDIGANASQYDTISRYIGEYALNGQFDFVLYHATAYRVWADDQFGMLHLDYWTRASLQSYPPSAVMTPFIGSHDSQRFISLAHLGSGDPRVHHKWPSQGLPPPPDSDEPYQRAAVAMTWLLSVPGAPLLYYGDEYGEHGGGDPDNRHMWRGPGERNAREQALFDRVARAATARRDHIALRRGDYTTLDATETFLAFARHTGGELAVVALNHSAAPVTRTVELPPTIAAAPSSLTDALSPGGGVVAVEDRRFTVTLPPRSAAVLVP